MGEKVLSSRIQNKCDTTANWAKATNFIPKSGEIIIYSDGGGAGKPKLKVGDGSTAVGSLKFCDADSASTLSTGRTIKIQGGSALYGKAVTFDGSKDIEIPLGTVQASYLTWGGRNIAGTLGPIDVAISNLHNANRLAFASPSCLTIEYSNDGGSTWNDYPCSDANKTRIMSDFEGSYIVLGNKTSATSTSPVTTSDQLRITINAYSAFIYTQLKSLLINYSTAGSYGGKVLIEGATLGTPTKFSTIGTYNLEGWSGWNSIPLEMTFGAYSNTNTQYIGILRLTFSIQGVYSGSAGNAQVINLRLCGATLWRTPSTMAANGHLYTYDVYQNTTFPASLSASKFVGPLNYSLSINGKTFNNSSSITVGTLGLAYGGTGQTNRKDALKTFLGQNSATDLNSALDLGTYTWSSSSTNTPVSGGYGTLVNLLNMGSTKSDSTWLTQLAFGTNKQFYWRSKINADTFTDWKTIVDTSNYTTTLPAITTAQIEEICSATVLDASEVTV